MKRFIWGGCICIMLLLSLSPPDLWGAAEYITPVKPFSKKVKQTVRSVKEGVYLRVPCITWGGEVAAVLANGGLKTTDGSIFDDLGLAIELYRQDDFVKQVEDYLTGKTPFLRGTLGMINVASEVCARDERTKPVVILQLTWSAGGDMLVAKSHIKRPRNLKNETICLQQYSPHIDYLDTILRDAGLTWNNIKVKWVIELTQPPYDTRGKAIDPASAMRQDKSIDAVCCISPDGFALTSGGKQGTGAEDSVKGAKILLSTKTANRVIADVWVVRQDYFKKNKAKVEQFVIGYLQGVERVQELMKDKKNQTNAYRQMLTRGSAFLFDSPQATADVEGLLLDCEFAGFPGNVDFFTNKGNLNNFERTCHRIQSFLVRENYISRNTSLSDAGWNYNNWKQYLKDTTSVPTKRFAPQKTTKRLAEKQARGNLDQDVLFEFTIHFKPNQNTFEQKVYGTDFKKAIEIAGRYGGAVVQIAGHSDPMAILKTQKKISDAQKAGKNDLSKGFELKLDMQKKAVKNLSLTRANNVRDALIAYAGKEGITIDPSQFTVAGFGIGDPIYSKPKTKEQWLANMRVAFRIIKVEAELEEFEALDF
ncbi:nitrate ABC transporter substrate-binding protein [candidate division CSSED10-310 bacterium]|uniref:Nitrate ABC transporter substrate-binding protein n=1 Tax=candidate division CSSED10-310 bacterium TaxID=2855610 RepID=A0ABV6YU40_UNCC1